ncbi:MAG: hypothetical protein J7L95_04330 [Prolixibacteraceae bacterium]|nr:hypothetical protein [Prolixibacteraceae bacterium]
MGWYKFENLSESVKIALVSHAYNRKSDGKYTDQSRNDLNLLGYPEGKISKGVNFITYNQKGWGDFSYQISPKWNVNRNKLIGCWSVSSANKGWKETPKANKIVTAEFDQISVKTDDGKRKLKMSSSPEVYNNSRKAWFAETTNFDLALIRWTYEKAAELATELGLKKDAAKWKQILSEWPQLAIDPETGFMFAPGFPYNQSHRHFSHQMAYHPLGLVDCSKGEADKKIILNTLRNLEKQGSDWWTGYSFSWLGNLYARAFEGEKAANALHTFAQCFCLKNSFHVNGDQCKAG